jgi:polar amino acid transport system substrate-binding protein
VVQPPFGKKSYFAYLGRKDADADSLIAALDAAMLKMHADGRLAALQKKYLGAEMDVPKADFTPTW